MTLVPIGGRILVSRKNVEKVGSLYVPKTSKEAKVSIGEVVAVGDAVEAVEVGDLITFGRYAPHTVDPAEFELYGIKTKTEDCDLLLMNEEDALCIVMEDA